MAAEQDKLNGYAIGLSAVSIADGPLGFGDTLWSGNATVTAARCGAGTRDGSGKAWRVGYRNEFPKRGLDGLDDFMFLAHHGFVKLGDDGQIMVLDIDDNDGIGE
jgi:hypothetical protein